MEKVSGTLSRPPSRDPGGGYNYESYHFAPSSTSSATVSAAAVKLQSQQPEANKTCCSVRCCRQFTRGCCSNIGVCLLLVAYTLLGSFIFLAIEGDAGGGAASTYESFVEPTSRPTQGHFDTIFEHLAMFQLSPEQRSNTTAWLRRANAASRARAVENIWDVTIMCKSPIVAEAVPLTSDIDSPCKLFLEVGLYLKYIQLTLSTGRSDQKTRGCWLPRCGWSQSLYRLSPTLSAPR
ncbi:hypothetical protein B566_EDAN009066 [Ephemera danica]|nr:hypothetical protein B566_EDAN009066 [Ephemera danica]